MPEDPGSLAVVIPTAYLSGGVQTWLDYIVPGLERRGWQVTVLPVHGRLHDAREYLRHHPFRKVRIVANETGSREGRMRSLAAAIEGVDPDVVLCVNIVDTYEAMARLRRKGNVRARIAMALHGFNAPFFRDIGVYGQVLDAVVTTNRLGVAGATAIGGMEESRIHYAPCGVQPGEPLGDIPWEETITLLFAGRFDQREKRILDLPGILARLAERKVPFRLRLAGSGPDEDALRAALSAFGDAVEFVGQLDGRALRAEFYRPGSILLITSPSESGPLVAWEAMSCAVAVVTARFLGIGREGGLRDGETCMTFPVGDCAAAADAVQSLQDRDRRGRLIQEGRLLVERRYSLEASTAAWDGALRAIAERPPMAAPDVAAASRASGRLDRLLGTEAAESVRRALGLEFRHSEPGGEWPHSYSGGDDSEFFAKLGALDGK